MLKKLLVPLIFFSAQFLIAWYGWFTGKMSTKGSYLGIHYDSAIIQSIVVQFEYLWILIGINILFSLGFHFGFSEYKNFLAVAIIWIAAGPLASLLFNAIFVKEKFDPMVIIGVVLITVGAILVVAHKEIGKILT